MLTKVTSGSSTIINVPISDVNKREIVGRG